MLNFFRNIRQVTDSEDELRYHLIWFLLIRIILYTLLLGITFLLHTSEQHLILPPSPLIILYILIIYVYTIGSAFLLRTTKRLRRFGMLQILSDTFFIALLVYATGCSQSIFLSVFILPIIAGGLILYRIGGLIPAASSTILFGTVLTSEYLGILPKYYFDSRYIPVDNYLVSMNIFAIYGLTFFLIAMISGIIARRLRKAEDALTRTELQLDRLLLLYKQIFDDIQTGIITVDDQDRITSFNPAAENITGYSAAEVSGRKLHETFPLACTDTKDRQVGDLLRKDGARIRVGYSHADLHLSIGPDPQDPACTSCKVITLQDISRIEEMEQQMRQAEKMAAIGEMSASIAHDFRNPLAAISGSAQLLALELADRNHGQGSVGNSLAGIVVREADRMNNTITDFLHYARPAAPDRQWFNLRRLAEETVTDLPERLAAHCPIRLDIPADMDIQADRQLLQIALHHLLRNSCYAAKDSGEEVVIQATEATSTGHQETDQVVIEITDQGTGFDPALAERLFEPFFTTREDASGLGLPIVQQIVTAHHGTVSLAPNHHRGCTARIVLPLTHPTL